MIGAKLGVKADVAILSTTADSTERQLPMQPSFRTRISAEHQLARDVVLRANLAIVGEQNVALFPERLPAGVDETVGGRFLLGAGGSYWLNDKVELFGDISNLLNQKYDVWSEYSAPGIELRVGARARL
jgi:outer membrane cobalamin receptor